MAQRDVRWDAEIDGVYCDECWMFWPGLRPFEGEVCPDGCHSKLVPAFKTSHGVVA